MMPRRAETRPAACVSPADVRRSTRRLQVSLCDLPLRRAPCPRSGALEQKRALDGVVRELGRLLDSTPCLADGAEGAGTIGGSSEQLSRLRLDLVCVVGLDVSFVGGEVVRSDDFHDFLLRDAEALLELGCGGEVTSLAVAA